MTIEIDSCACCVLGRQDTKRTSAQPFPALLNSSFSDSEKCCYSYVKCHHGHTTVLSNLVGILICYVNDWCLKFSVTQMVPWQHIGCYKITLNELKYHCMNGFHMNGANAEWVLFFFKR